jgi:pyruvate ferredoxin oxidoreductase alpha subunit
MKKLIEGSHAVAEAVKLCEPKVIASYPISPQTHIPERLSEMVADGELDAQFLNVESEHSAMAACIGAIATGVRVYTATASAGLALMHEMLGVASGMRLPIVMTVVNRALSSPLNIWNDWSDAMSERDMGWIQLYVETAQEAYDTTIQAYKIAEKLRLPVMVCMDGFWLSHTFEPVEVLKRLDGFLPHLKLNDVLDTKNPKTLGFMAGPDYFQEFREEQFKVMKDAKKVITDVGKEFGDKFGRNYGLLEMYNMPNKYAIITMGTLAGTIKHMIDEGLDVGLVKLRAYRPFPQKELQGAIKECASVGILEKHICTGSTGNIFSELKTDVYVTNFIGGLGGRDIPPGQIKKIVDDIKKKKGGVNFV